MFEWMAKFRATAAQMTTWACACVLFLGCASLILGNAANATQETYEVDRRAMVSEIKQDARLTGFLTGRDTISARVMDVMAAVLRHEFVPERWQRYAYENRPLPIGHGQTISQPYIVAIMTDLLGVDNNDVVLEVGTGSGYQAAVLAHLVRSVYTIEIIPPLGQQARDRLARLGYDNVQTRIGDGYYGWEEHGPFDGIIVTAAASHVPPPLIQQLKPGAKMVIPVGSLFFTQQLMVVEKDKAGRVSNRQILPVAFVPLTGKH